MHIRHREVDHLQGVLQVNDPIKITKNDGFVVKNKHNILKVIENGAISETIFTFSTDKGAYLRMRLGGQGLPIIFKISGEIKPIQIFVGLGKVSPKSMNFSLTTAVLAKMNH